MSEPLGLSRGSDAPLPEPTPWQSRGTHPAGRRRLVWLDTLRGAALGGMIVFHVAWDLHAFGLSAIDPGRDPGWHAFGTGVATLFLGLSGFGLALAARQGVTRARMLGRLGRIALAAASVTLATRWAVPQAPIWFGILHCIAVTNAIALFLQRSPVALLLALAAAAFAAPRLLGGGEHPGLVWLGLGANEPATLDFRPVLPWLAPVLAGMALGRLVGREPLGAARLRAPDRQPLAYLGRHSLAVYLIHQPVLIGILVAVTGGMPGSDPSLATLRRPAEATNFLRECRTSCLASGGQEDLCGSTCHCVLTAAERSDGAGSPQQGQARHGDALQAAIALCRPPSPTIR